MPASPGVGKVHEDLELHLCEVGLHRVPLDGALQQRRTGNGLGARNSSGEMPAGMTHS